MSNYTKTTNFSTKDSLPSGDPNKIVKGAEINTEFDNIATAVATKSNLESPAFTGTVTIPTADINGGAIDGTTIGGATAAPVTSTTLTANTSLNIAGDGATVTGIKDEDDMASNSATKLATQQSIKAYVDSQVTAQDLDVTTDSGTIAIDLDSETLTVTGGTGLDSSATGNAVTLNIDSTVATLTGTQTLTNKTLTTPVISGNLTTDGTIDGRDVATDGTKLDTVETNADVTDTVNVTAAGALMDSEVTNLAQVKAFDSTDYATAAQGTTADAALPKSGGAMTGAITTNSTFDGRDVAADGSKLDGIESGATADQTAAEIRTLVESATDSNVFTDADHSKLNGIEASADVTDTTNVVAALSAGTGISLSAGGEIANTAPDQTVALTGAGGTTISGTYPNFTISSTAGGGGGETLAQTLAIGNTTGGADISFGDNDKATFGAGSDLQIYHDGTHSYIADVGSGVLFLRGESNVVLENNSGNNYFEGTSGGASTIYHAGNAKLATTSTGIDVTGTVTADGVNVGNTSDAYSAVFITTSPTGESELRMGDTDTDAGSIAYTNSDDTMTFRAAAGARMTLDSTGIDVTGTATMDGLTVDGSGTITNTAAGVATALSLKNNTSGANNRTAIDLFSASTKYVTLEGGYGASSPTFNLKVGNPPKLAMSADGNGDISFYEDTGTTPKLFWDASAESLGIGTTSPSQKLTLSNGTFQINGSSSFSSNVEIGRVGSDNNMGFATGGTERMRIDSSGNVGIGTASPFGRLSVDVVAGAPASSGNMTNGFTVHNSNGGRAIQLGVNESGSYNYLQSAYVNNANVAVDMAFFMGANERMRIDSSGNVGIGTASPAFNLTTQGSSGTVTVASKNTGGNASVYVEASNTNTAKLELAEAGTGSYSLQVGNDDALMFFDDSSERMRIDSSGNLLVGKTTSSSATAGITLEPAGAVVATRDGGECFIANRKTSYGTIIQLRKDQTTVGSIGTADVGNGYSVYMSTDAKGLRIENIQGSGAVIPCDGSGAILDDSIDLGKSSAKFDDVYATNGTIQTSDRNEKQDIEVLSDAEQRVAVACKGLLRKFRWKSAVEEKGDEARIHFGIIAQDLQDAFTAEGLDADDYAMFINTTWTDEETGEERSRMGVRYSELLAFIISAI